MAQGPHARARRHSGAGARRSTRDHRCATVHRAARFVFSLWAGLSLQMQLLLRTQPLQKSTHPLECRKRAHRGGSAWSLLARGAATNEQRSPRPGPRGSRPARPSPPPANFGASHSLLSTPLSARSPHHISSAVGDVNPSHVHAGQREGDEKGGHSRYPPRSYVYHTSKVTNPVWVQSRGWLGQGRQPHLDCVSAVSRLCLGCVSPSRRATTRGRGAYAYHTSRVSNPVWVQSRGWCGSKARAYVLKAPASGAGGRCGAE